MYDTLFVNPVKILLSKLILLIDIRRDILAIADLLQKRAKFITRRNTGTMNTYNHLVQHFNPACRASRMSPELSVSRMLISMNDDDLTFSTAPTTTYDVMKMAMSPVIFFTRYYWDLLTFALPDYFYNAVTDIICVLLLNTAMVIVNDYISYWLTLSILSVGALGFLHVGIAVTDVHFATSEDTFTAKENKSRWVASSEVDQQTLPQSDYNLLYTKSLRRQLDNDNQSTTTKIKSKRRREKENRRIAIVALRTLRSSRSARMFASSVVVPVDTSTGMSDVTNRKINHSENNGESDAGAENLKVQDTLNTSSDLNFNQSDQLHRLQSPLDSYVGSPYSEDYEVWPDQEYESGEQYHVLEYSRPISGPGAVSFAENTYAVNDNSSLQYGKNITFDVEANDDIFADVMEQGEMLEYCESLNAYKNGLPYNGPGSSRSERISYSNLPSKSLGVRYKSVALLHATSSIEEEDADVGHSTIPVPSSVDEGPAIDNLESHASVEIKAKVRPKPPLSSSLFAFK